MTIEKDEVGEMGRESITAERDEYIRLSVVIPAYNEESRISATIADAADVLNARFGDRWELIVVDDGSKDNTVDVVRRLSHLVPSLRVLSHLVNQGKGAAVRTGVLAATCSPTCLKSGTKTLDGTSAVATSRHLILFADADGATPMREIHKLLAAIDVTADVAIASRCGASQAAIQRTKLRAFTAWIFRRAVNFSTGTQVQDTQCGFKLFRSQVAERLFTESIETGYLFDIEILALAQRYGFVVCEVPVDWRDVPGSKIRFVRDSWKMLCGLLRIRQHMIRAHVAELRRALNGSCMTSAIPVVANGKSIRCTANVRSPRGAGL